MPDPAKVLLRLPVELHAAIVEEAERQGVSVNTLLIALLAGGIGWRQEERS